MSGLGAMRSFSAVIERCPETGLLVGYVPGFSGAHSQAESLDELQANLQEVISMLLEHGEPHLDSDFVRLADLCPCLIVGCSSPQAL